MNATDLIIGEDLDVFSPNVFGERRCIMIVRCFSGELRLKRHTDEFTIVENDLLICLSDYLIGHYMRTPDFSCRYYACPQQELAKHAYRCLRVEPDWWDKINYMLNNPIIHLNNVQKEFAKHFYNQISFYKSRTDSPYQSEMLDLAADLAIYELLTFVTRMMGSVHSAGSAMNASDELLRRFMRLLQENIYVHREVQWYASQLAITPKHLSRLMRERTGKTALDCITEMAVQQIKSELIDSTDDIKQIAMRMNFSSLTFFCKYVHKHLGMTPMQFRSQK